MPCLLERRINIMGLQHENVIYKCFSNCKLVAWGGGLLHRWWKSTRPICKSEKSACEELFQAKISFSLSLLSGSRGICNFPSLLWQAFLYEVFNITIWCYIVTKWFSYSQANTNFINDWRGCGTNGHNTLSGVPFGQLSCPLKNQQGNCMPGCVWENPARIWTQDLEVWNTALWPLGYSNW